MAHQDANMTRGFVATTIRAILSIAWALSLTSCGNSTDPLPTASTSSTTTSAPTGTTSSGLAFGCAYSSVLSTDIICVAVAATTVNLNADGISTATISATVTKNGSPITNNVVNFSLGNATYGTLTQVTALSSSAGVATTTFKAGTTPGAVQINASYDTASSYVAVGLASTSTATALSPGCAYSSTVATDVICVAAVSSTTSLTADGTSKATITATVTKNGTPQPSVVVNFSTGSNQYGVLSAATGLTGAAGTATTTFQASTTLGAVQISVLYDTASTSTAIGLVASTSTSAAGGVQFVSAVPPSIGVQGSGLTTTSSVKFKVTDAVGAAISGATVDFTMIGPGGGTYIGATPGATTATGVTDTSGNVSITLNSGNLAGTATIKASVTQGGTTFSASSSVLSIGGAVPSGRHFTLAAKRHNLPGLVVANFQTTLSVFVADRFSNAAVLAGTQVCIYTEAGAVTRDALGNPCVAVDSSGMGTTTFRTQNPMPDDIDGVAPFPNFSFNPQDGWVSVLAVVRGEESFVDVNGNGKYDSGEPFTDLGEPFIDANDNGVWDGPGCTQAGCITTHPGEFYVDTSGSGVYNGPNGVWDGPGCAGTCNTSPYIWVRESLMFTGNLFCTITLASGASANNFDIANASTQDFLYFVSDENFNWPVPGTTIAVTFSPAAAGTIAGQLTATVPDSSQTNGPYSGKFRVGDAAPLTVAANLGSITLTVTTPAGEVVACLPETVFGTVR